MLIELEKIRTLRCPHCDGITATNKDACPHCGEGISPDVARQAADREDLLLTMEHDASHALHSAEVACLWNFLILVPVLHQLWDDLKTASLNYELALYEISLFMSVSLIVMPLFLAYAVYLVVMWYREFSNVRGPEVRVSEAWREWRKARLLFGIGVGIYLVVDVIPLVSLGPNVFGL